MITILEKRHEFGNGTMTTHYEIRTYSHRSEHTGALLNGKTVKCFNTLKEAYKYIARYNIKIDEAV